MSRGGVRGLVSPGDPSIYSGRAIGTGQGTLPRWTTWANTAILAASQQAAFQYIRAIRTETINNIRTFSATTAAGATPTLCKVGLYSMASNGDLTRVGISANTTSLWASTNTTYTTALTAGVDVVAGNDYMVAMLIVSAAAMPTHVAMAEVSTMTGFLTDYIGGHPQFTGLATGQADLAASYLAANIDTSFNRPFYAVLLP